MEATLKKMNFKAGQRMLVVNVPQTCKDLVTSWKQEDPTLMEMCLDQARGGIEGEYDFILSFVFSDDQVQGVLDSLKDALDSDSALWFAYPKKTSKSYKATINRDSGWQALGALNYEPVRLIAIDDDFSALRFKPVDAIKTLTRNAKMTLSQAAKDRLEG